MSKPASPNALPAVGDSFIVERCNIQILFDALLSLEFQVIAPTVRDTAIVYDMIDHVDDLPIGWTDVQEAGSYHLERRTDEALFGYNVGPQSWKTWLYPSRLKLWRAKCGENGLEFEEPDKEQPKYAFIGVRACELNAILVQDRVLVEGAYQDQHYKTLRESTFIVAVNCVEAGATCFCASMETGPKVERAFDLAITELIDTDRHEFLIEVGTQDGAKVLSEVPHRSASADDIKTALERSNEAAMNMGRQLDTGGIQEMLQDNLQNPRWDRVAERCLSCGNCTNVCPTCFCTTIEDVTDLTGEHAERHRSWESCFSLDFSYIHGSHVRPDTRSRYRQWLTHKLANWIDQFGVSGCVGCGRCIAWCPVAIDITEEVAGIRDTPA